MPGLCPAGLNLDLMLAVPIRLSSASLSPRAAGGGTLSDKCLLRNTSGRSGEEGAQVEGGGAGRMEGPSVGLWRLQVAWASVAWPSLLRAGPLCHHGLRGHDAVRGDTTRS